MSRILILVLSGFAVVWVGVMTAMAAPMAAALRDDGFVLAPFSFAKFCLDYPGDCPAAGGSSRVTLTPLRFAELSAVNRAVNAAIVPTRDTSRLRFWHLNVAAGDCNSFAVQKRHELMARGWPPGAVSLTVVKTAWGEGHLIVTVRTDRGDLALDNLRSSILSWRQTGYQYVMRQSGKNPQFWVELHGGMIDPNFAANRAGAADDLAMTETPTGAAAADNAAYSAPRPPRPLSRRAPPSKLVGATEMLVASSPAQPPSLRGVRQMPRVSSAEADASEFRETLFSWLTRGDAVIARFAPELYDAVAQTFRLAITEGTGAHHRPTAPAVGSIDPTGYGVM